MEKEESVSVLFVPDLSCNLLSDSKLYRVWVIVKLSASLLHIAHASKCVIYWSVSPNVALTKEYVTCDIANIWRDCQSHALRVNIIEVSSCVAQTSAIFEAESVQDHIKQMTEAYAH